MGKGLQFPVGKWLAAACAIIFLLCSQAAAQEGAAVRMDPMLVERTVRPGDSFTYFIYLTNEDRFNPVTLDVQIADISEDATGSYRLQPVGSTPYSLERIVRVEPQRLTVQPASLVTNVPCQFLERNGILGPRRPRRRDPVNCATSSTSDHSTITPL